MKIGSIVRKLRKEASITQGELAKESGITQVYLSQIENNKRDPHLSSIKKISKTLKVPLPILLFLAMDEEDIPENKREAFKVIFPAVQGLLTQFLPNPIK